MNTPNQADWSEMDWCRWMSLLTLEDMEHIAKKTGYWTDPAKAPEFEKVCNDARAAKAR